ncbi:MAG TPA: hypothetical protein VMI54_04220 [Polyangiaceae bacterium]|nr:hypothetical protein [Polyangiaceae bacterium]
MTTPRDPIAWEATLPIRPSSPAWRATIRALYGTTTDEDRTLFRELAQREAPDGGADELLVVAGRRGGKSETIARLAVFEAIHGGHSDALAPGQLGIIPIISPLREQSQEIMGFARGLVALSQIKRHLASEPTRDAIRLKSNVEIRVMTSDAVNVSGPTVVCAIRDELAKGPTAGMAGSDVEVDQALRPALAPVIGAPRRRLISITSAYIREGLAFETDRDHFGRDDSPLLVVRGTTRQFNPNIDDAWLARERKRVGDAVFAREYEGAWQDAILNGWFGQATIGRAVRYGSASLPWAPPTEVHIALDAAFSETGDCFGWAAASHAPGGDNGHGGRNASQTTVHACGAWKVDREPRAMAQRVRDEICLRYGTRRVTIDQYQSDTFRRILEDEGLSVTVEKWLSGDSDDSKAAKYRAFRDAMAAGEMSLPDSPELRHDLARCRGELLPGGSERIEVPRSRRGHGDCLAAVVLAASVAMGGGSGWYQPSTWTSAETQFAIGGIGGLHSSFRGGW